MSFSQVVTELTGALPRSLSNYYGASDGIVASGTLNLSDFYAKYKTYPAKHLPAYGISNGEAPTEGTVGGAFNDVMDTAAANKWSSAQAYADTVNGWLGQDFTVPVQVRYIKFLMHRWSRYFDIYVGDSLAALTLLRRLDWQIGTSWKDDTGIFIKTGIALPYNHIELPAYTAKRFIVFKCPVYEDGLISDKAGVAGANSRLGLIKMRCYG